MIPFKNLIIQYAEGILGRSSLELRFARNTFWTLGSALISRFLTLVSFLLVARIIGQEEYGKFGMIRSTIFAFVVFAGLGLGITATKFIAELRTESPRRAEKIIGLTYLVSLISGMLVILLFFFGADLIATGILHAPYLASSIRISSLTLFFAILSGTQIGILSGFEDFKSITLSNVWAGAIWFPVQIALAYYYGIEGSIIGLTINQGLLCVFLQFRVRSHLKSQQFTIPISFHVLRDEYKLLWKFSLPAFLASLIAGPVLWICNTMLINQPGGYEELAIVDVGNQWKEIIMFIPATISASLIPLLSGFRKDDKSSYVKVLKIYYLVTISASVLVALPVVIFSKKVLILYDFEHARSSLILILYSISAIFIVIGSGVGQVLASKDKMWQAFLLNLFWSVTILIFSRVLIDRNYGALGLAISFFISYGLLAIAFSLYLYRLMKRGFS